MTEPQPPTAAPTVIVVGSAARDITADDPRGWRLGGGVSYSALTTALLGLPTGAIIGVDAEASRAAELDLLRVAGVDIHLVPLEHGPVFVNIERPEGRHQLCRDRSDSLPVGAVPDAWRSARGWLLAPVAAELPDAWADLPAADAIVGVGWQGLLRDLTPGEPVRQLAPGPNRIIERADIVGLSRDDIDESTVLSDLAGLLRPGATLAVTRGDKGGIVLETDRAGSRPAHSRYYPPVRSHNPIDPTGAGDVFLAALAAARIEPRLVGRRADAGFDLLLAAAAASLVLEGPGLLGVPDRAAVRERIRAARLEGASAAG
jgi:sugar/nucleoside kinase (ribokinase family)